MGRRKKEVKGKDKDLRPEVEGSEDYLSEIYKEKRFRKVLRIMREPDLSDMGCRTLFKSGAILRIDI